jgi:hypothetical protein
MFLSSRKVAGAGNLIVNEGGFGGCAARVSFSTQSDIIISKQFCLPETAEQENE